VARRREHADSCSLDDASVRLVGDTPVKIAVGDVLGKLYEVRNCIAHGRKIPDTYFNVPMSIAAKSLCEIQVLLEALSAIVRASSLKTLSDGLPQHFADNASAEGLLRRQLIDGVKTSSQNRGFR